MLSSEFRSKQPAAVLRAGEFRYIEASTSVTGPKATLSQPTIESDRLTLRPFRLRDAPDVQLLAGAREIADTTMNVPHPYEDGMAEEWICGHQSAYESGEALTYAIAAREDGSLVGAIGLRIDREYNRAELGYWVGKPFWNHGYATEAATTLLAYGFEELELNRIHAAHLARNRASGRVMEKVGMLLEGTARQHTMKWGDYEDVVSYGLLREDWLKR